MGSVEGDLRRFESEQATAFSRQEYAEKNYKRFMDEAIEKEVRLSFAGNLETAAEKLAQRGSSAARLLAEAYLTGDDCELGRFIRAILKPEIEESARVWAEGDAVAEFDGGRR